MIDFQTSFGWRRAVRQPHCQPNKHTLTCICNIYKRTSVSILWLLQVDGQLISWPVSFLWSYSVCYSVCLNGFTSFPGSLVQSVKWERHVSFALVISRGWLVLYRWPRLFVVMAINDYTFSEGCQFVSVRPVSGGDAHLRVNSHEYAWGH